MAEDGKSDGNGKQKDGDVQAGERAIWQKYEPARSRETGREHKHHGRRRIGEPMLDPNGHHEG